MTEEKQPAPETSLTHELAETASTLARLGVTLAGLPVAMLPREQRATVRQLTHDLLRFASAIPNAVGSMLEQTTEEKPREDLGSRLRREQRELEKEQRHALRTAAYAGGPEEDEAQLEGEAPATEQVEEDLQDAWESPPTSDDGR